MDKHRTPPGNRGTPRGSDRPGAPRRHQLLAGFKTRWGVVALLVFLVRATLVFHNFWAAQGPELQQQLTQFLKNVAIGGGLFVEFAAGPGALSVDSRLAKGHAGDRRGAETARPSHGAPVRAGGR
jgi:SURF4 family